jgi:hypothetical protein
MQVLVTFQQQCIRIHFLPIISFLGLSAAISGDLWEAGPQVL